MSTLPADLEAAIDVYASSEGMTRDEAIAHILRDWVRRRGSIEGKDGDEGSDRAEPGKPDPEFFQYPGYFEGKGRV